MRRKVATAVLLALALPLLGGCWVSAGTRVGLGGGSYVGYSSPIFSTPGPGFGTHLGVRVD